MSPLNIITMVSTVIVNLLWLSEAAVEPLHPGAFRLSLFFSTRLEQTSEIQQGSVRQFISVSLREEFNFTRAV